MTLENKKESWFRYTDVKEALEKLKKRIKDDMHPAEGYWMTEIVKEIFGAGLVE